MRRSLRRKLPSSGIRSLKDEFYSNCVRLCRDLNQKLFPILSISEMTDDFYQMFTENETGFAFLAFYNDTLVCRWR